MIGAADPKPRVFIVIKGRQEIRSQSDYLWRSTLFIRPIRPTTPYRGASTRAKFELAGRNEKSSDPFYHARFIPPFHPSAPLCQNDRGTCYFSVRWKRTRNFLNLPYAGELILHLSSNESIEEKLIHVYIHV